MTSQVRSALWNLTDNKQKNFPALQTICSAEKKLVKSRGPILRVTSSETRSVCVKQALNTHC